MAYAVSVLGTAEANRNTGNPAISITTGSSDTLLVVMAYMDDTTEGDVDDLPSDSDGDTYVEAHSFASGNLKGYIWYVDSPTQSSVKNITIHTSTLCDTVACAVTFTGTVHATPVGDTGDGSATSASLATGTGGNTLSAARDSSVIVAMFGQNNNSTVGSSTYGTNQNEVSDDANGGAEKFYGAMSYEIITATGTNEQSITMTKSAAGIVLAAEFQHADESSRRIFNV